MTRDVMTARRFAWLLRTRGPAVAAWPETDRAAAVALLRHDAVTRQFLADALSAEDAPQPDCVVLARMQAVVRQALAPATPVARGMRWGALAACVAVGLYVGVAWTPADLQAASALAPTIQASSPATVLAALEP